MAIVEVGTYQDVFSQTSSNGVARTGTTAGNLIVGTVRGNTTESCTVTCPGETVVIAIDISNSPITYYHCQYYILLTSGGTKNITATWPTATPSSGHYVAEYSGVFNVSTVLTGAEGNVGTNAILTIPGVPAGGLGWGVATSSDPNPGITPLPSDQRALINEWWPTEGAVHLPSPGGSINFENGPGSFSHVLNTFVAYQEDAAPAPSALLTMLQSHV